MVPAPSTVNHILRRGTQARNPAVSSTAHPKNARVITTPDHHGTPSSCALLER